MIEHNVISCNINITCIYVAIYINLCVYGKPWLKLGGVLRADGR